MMMTDGATLISQQIDVEGVYTLASAPAYDAAIADPDAEYTAFTGQLIALLGEGVPDASTLTLAGMFPHLKRALVSSNYPEPQQCIRATAGDLVLVRNGETVLSDPGPQVAVTIPPVDYGTAAGTGSSAGDDDGPGQVLPHRVPASGIPSWQVVRPRTRLCSCAS